MDIRASLLTLLTLAAACDSRAPAPTTPSQDLSPRAQHPFFPLTPGMVWTYAGTEQGLPRHERVATLYDKRKIDGVTCTAVQQEISIDDALAEITTEWFALDAAGNLWTYGEETLVPEGDGYAVAESWLAGVDGALPWIAFPANPSPGDVFSSANASNPNAFEVHSVTANARVPAGTFSNCAEIVENPDDPDDMDIILYAPGVGRIQEINAGGTTQLVTVRRE